jgi:sulfopyruvate decarboxylase TPP-binding subunit
MAPCDQKEPNDMNTEAANEALHALIESGIDFAACLPDSAFQELYLPLSTEAKIDYIQVANEGDGVGICMGAWLGGKKPVLIMENTGFAVTPYALMRGPIPFGVPMLLLIAHRGGFHDQRWFSVPMGWGTAPLLEAMRISYEYVTHKGDIRTAIQGAVKSMNSIQAPVAVVFAGELLF